MHSEQHSTIFVKRRSPARGLNEDLQGNF